MVSRTSSGKRRFRGWPLAIGVAYACVLPFLLGCNDYNPYLGATPTVSSAISSISPSGANINLVHGDILLTVNGAGFAAGSNVTWSSSNSAPLNLVSNVLSANEVQADIPASLLTTPGKFFVGVIAPGPSTGNNAGNNISNFVPFIVCSTTCADAVPGLGAKTVTSSSESSLSRLSALIQAGPRYQAVVVDSADGAVGMGSGLARISLYDTCRGAVDCTPQTYPVSVGWNGADPNGPSSSPSVTAGGRFVVFASGADNLVKDDTNGTSDIFLRDTCIGSQSTCVPSTTRLSLGPDGAEANGPSSSPAISPDGRFVVFNSLATDLAPQIANPFPDAALPLFLRDTCFGAVAGCVPRTWLITPASASR